MVEGGRESTGAHSPGLVVAFIRRRLWGVVVSKGACRSWGIIVIQGWGIVLVCWWGDRPRALEGCAGGGTRRPSWFHCDGLSMVVVMVKQWWWWFSSSGGGGCR